MRAVLTERVAAGMKAAWESRRPLVVSAADVEWRVHPVLLSPGSHLNTHKAAAVLADPKASSTDRFNAAGQIAFLNRSKKAGYPAELSCLKLGSVYLLHMPGELFVEYQLAAQKLRPQETVCMAAYGDYSPFYIGTDIAYSEGGYETDPRSTHVGTGVEGILMKGIRESLK